MSEEELIGRIAAQYKAAKERLAKYRSEAHLIANALRTVSLLLNQANVMDPASIPRAWEVFPTAEYLKQLLANIEEAAAEAERARAELDKLGLTVR